MIVFAGCKWGTCSQCPCCHEQGKEENAPEHNHDQHAQALINLEKAQDFDEKVLKATKPVVVDFNASWCGPCQTMRPIFHKLAHELSDKFVFVAVDVDAFGDLAQRYSVQGVPTFVFFKDGKEVERLVGAVSAEMITKTLEKNVGK